MPVNDDPVQVHAAEHMRKKTVQQLRGQASVSMEKPPSGSTLYRNGIKKRNERKLREHQCLLQVTYHTLWKSGSSPFSFFLQFKQQIFLLFLILK